MAKRTYDHLSREDLIALLKKRDAERKLGLVWERDEIEHEAALNSDFVAMDLVDELSVGEGPHRNFIIEGDNFDALRYLSIAYKGRIKCIYIDPPYNTGNKDFIYNDSYVDKEDGYRHSKWLEFMCRRLSLAKELLTEDGVILVSINDENRARLELLMDQVFPMQRVGSFVWKCRPGGNDTHGALLSDNHEHVLAYGGGGFSFAGEGREEGAYTNPDNDSRGPWNSSPLIKTHNAKQRPEAYYTIFNPETETYYPCDPDSVWRFSSTSRPLRKKLQADPIETIIDEGRLLWPEGNPTITYSSVEELKKAISLDTAPKPLKIYLDLPQLKKLAVKDEKVARLVSYIEPIEAWVGRRIGLVKPRYKRFRSQLLRDVTPLSSWLNPAAEKASLDTEEEQVTLSVGTTAEGTVLLKKLVGHKDFPYPKPLSLIKGLLQQATAPGDIVLDFFAGSGTTAHAVADLNLDLKQPARTFILVSNTESTRHEPARNICRDITAQRVRAAGAEFAYLRAHRIPMERLHASIRHDQVWIALQQLHAGAVTPWTGDALQLLDIADTDLYYISKVTAEVITALQKRARRKKPAVVYTWQPGILQQRIKAEHLAFERIPAFLVDRFGGQS